MVTDRVRRRRRRDVHDPAARRGLPRDPDGHRAGRPAAPRGRHLRPSVGWRGLRPPRHLPRGPGRRHAPPRAHLRRREAPRRGSLPVPDAGSRRRHGDDTGTARGGGERVTLGRLPT